MRASSLQRSKHTVKSSIEVPDYLMAKSDYRLKSVDPIEDIVPKTKITNRGLTKISTSTCHYVRLNIIIRSTRDISDEVGNRVLEIYEKILHK